MKQILIGGKVPAAQLAYGCMRLGKKDKKQAQNVVKTALSLGINFFDNADIYCSGVSEEYFGSAVSNSERDSIVVQTKCGIRPGFYDFSKEHIVKSAEQSLKRLNMDYLDILCLHRPDTLFEGEEVSEAFYELKSRSLVKNFGVSNFSPVQIELLKKYVDEPILCNQLQLGIFHSGMIDSGICANTLHECASPKAGRALEYSRLNDITIQAWGPMRSKNSFFPCDDSLKSENEALEKYAAKYGVSKEALSVAWIMRHPAKIQVLLGTTNEKRLKDYALADGITLSREDWYGVYKETGHIIP